MLLNLKTSKTKSAHLKRKFNKLSLCLKNMKQKILVPLYFTILRSKIYLANLNKKDLRKIKYHFNTKILFKAFTKQNPKKQFKQIGDLTQL